MSDSEIKQRTVYCITKIIKDNNYDLYVGSTSKSLRERLCNHKFLAKLPENMNNKFYRRMREVGLDKWEIKPLLVLKCSKEEIRTFERKLMKTLEADLNRYSTYYLENRCVILQQKKEYYTEHNK